MSLLLLFRSRSGETPTPDLESTGGGDTIAPSRRKKKRLNVLKIPRKDYLKIKRKLVKAAKDPIASPLQIEKIFSIIQSLIPPEEHELAHAIREMIGSSNLPMILERLEELRQSTAWSDPTAAIANFEDLVEDFGPKIQDTEDDDLEVILLIANDLS